MSVDSFRAVGVLVPYAYDAVVLSDYDVNGNAGTIKYYNGGTTGTLVATLTLLYDGSNNVTSIVRT